MHDGVVVTVRHVHVDAPRELADTIDDAGTIHFYVHVHSDRTGPRPNEIRHDFQTVRHDHYFQTREVKDEERRCSQINVTQEGAQVSQDYPGRER